MQFRAMGSRASALGIPLDRRMAAPTWVTMALLLLVLTGCTRLAVTPDRLVSDDRNNALSGVSYALPMLQYDMTITRTLTDCPTVVLDTGNTVWLDTLAVSMEVDAESQVIEGERYRTDYSKLDGLMKTTSFTIEYQTGSEILKSVNASVDDKTGEVIGNVAETILAGVAIASGPAGAAGAAALAAKAIPNRPAPAQGPMFAGNKSMNWGKYQLELHQYQAAAAEEVIRRELRGEVERSSIQRPLIVCSKMIADKVAARKDAAERG